MTKDEIIEMVMQIGGCDRPEDDSPALRMFEAFAKLVSEKAIKEALEQTEQKPVACERCKQLEEQAYDLLGKLKVANIKLSMRSQRTWAGLMRGVRVDGDTVVIKVKNGNDAARELCGALIEEMNK